MIRVLCFLLLNSVALAVFSQEDSDRADENLTSNVKAYELFSYDSLKANELKLLNGNRSSLRWIAEGFTYFNGNGSKAGYGYFYKDDTTTFQYAYDRAGEVTEERVLFNSKVYSRDVYVLNSFGKTDYIARIIEDDTVGYYRYSYEDMRLKAIKIFQADTLVCVQEQRQYDDARDRFTAWYDDGSGPKTRFTVQLSSLLVLDETTFYLDSTVYTTKSYSYRAGKVRELLIVNAWGEEKDTMRFVYEEWQPGYRVKIYEQDEEGKTWLSEIQYYKENGDHIRAETFNEAGKITLLTEHEYAYDSYGNWIYDITYTDGKPVSVIWRKLEYY